MTHGITEEKQRQKMLNTPVPRLVTSLAVPTVITMLITVIYNTADTFFISQINKSASAAVGAVYAVMSVIQAVGYGFGMGSGSLCSRRLGQQKHEEADRYCSSAFFAAAVVGGLIGILGLCFLEPMLSMLGCSETMMPYAIPYARYILMAAPVTCATFVLNNTLRSEGQARLAMFGMAGGGLLNLFLDPLLISVFHMGTAGAAIATALSQTVSFLVLLFQFLRKKTIIHIRLGNASRKLLDYGLILATGAPTICRQALGSVASAALNIQAVVYGDAAVAAMTISNKCYILVRNVVIGIGQGFQPAAGFNYGAGCRKRARESFLFACKAGTAVCLVSAVVLAVFSKQILWWFCKDYEVLEYGRVALLYGCAALPFLAFSTYVNQLYQCLGFKVPATFLASCRQGIFFLPVVLILPRFVGVTGVQMAQPLADFLTFLISCPFLAAIFRNKLSENQQTTES